MRKLETGETEEVWEWRTFGTCTLVASQRNHDRNPENCWLTLCRPLC